MRGLFLVALVSVAAEAQESRARFFDRVCPRTPGGRSTRGLGCDTGAFFEFAPASGAGLPVAQSLCAAAAQHFPGKDVSWCTNGDGTAASGTTLSVATEQDTVTETTQQVCPNGPDCAAMPVLRPTTAASGYTESANVNRGASVTTGSFTACVAYVAQSSAAVVINTALSQNNSSTWKYLLGNAASNPTFTRGTISTAACGAGATPLLGTIALDDGAPTVSCITWAASDGIYRLYTNGAADTVSASHTTICGGGGTSRFGVSGFWTGAAMENAPAEGGVFGAFYVDTTTGNGGQLSAAQILALSNAVLARGPTGAKGEALTFTRASARACESSTGLGSVAPPNVPCMAQNGFSAWPLGTVISARSNELDNAYWTATATVTANQARSFDGTLSADQLNDVSGAAQQGVSVAIATTSATRHAFACFLQAGTASSYSIGFTGTGDATGNVTVNGTGLTSTGVWVVATSPAAYLGTLTAVTPFVRVGDTVGVTGTIFASYCNHVTDSPNGMRSPAMRTGAAGVTRALDDIRFNGVVRSTASGSAALSWAPALGVQSLGSATANGGFFGSDTNGRFLYAGTTAIQSFDGTTIAATVVWTATADVAARFSSSWQTTRELRATGVADATGAAFDGAMGAAGSGIGLGGAIWGAVNMPGVYSRVCFDPDPLRCR